MIVDFYSDPRWGALCAIISYTANGKRYVAQPMELVFKEMEFGESAENTLNIRAIEGKEFLQALMAGLIEYGVKVPENLELKGKLEAQAQHIKFLEELVKAHWER